MFSRKRTLSMYGLGLLLAFFLASGTQGLELVDSTDEFFSPKIPLTHLRFVYLGEPDGKASVELSDEQPALLGEFEKKMLGMGDPLNYSMYPANGILTRKQQHFVFGRIPEKRGERYCVFFPETFSCGFFSLSEVMLKPTGDGGYCGFLGVLKPCKGTNYSAPTSEYLFGQAALAFRSDSMCAHPKRMDALVSDETILERIRGCLLKSAGLREQKILECRSFFLDYPNRLGYWVKVQGTKTLESEKPKDDTTSSMDDRIWHPTYLFCVSDEFEMLPFPEDNGMTAAEYGGLQIEIDDGPGCDVSPSHTKTFVLPDLDGDGVCELLVDTTVRQVYSLSEERDSSRDKASFKIHLVNESYFGP